MAQRGIRAHFQRSRERQNDVLHADKFVRSAFPATYLMNMMPLGGKISETLFFRYMNIAPMWGEISEALVFPDTPKVRSANETSRERGDNMTSTPSAPIAPGNQYYGRYGEKHQYGIRNSHALNDGISKFRDQTEQSRRAQSPGFRCEPQASLAQS
uniref:Uncharacterized protein n=1 Tax=Candidatus Kentrum sp. SD TaxID=2126332 RepID=A0A450YQC8_9GAMM|nr:MAG: hypothetical protein BECKSD772F_GA0070984_11551 [Candidatus Kentron sp. SD]VFK49057.1 MAG: hypothetical protein BECKSD772E_GA0070983_11561 [Candidatus Kentron sp. SD]VFK80839.1 MAG: hypothetical protein BECKSD772D_GA0070982_11644 [Candidatus Kentron sp. SD]